MDKLLTEIGNGLVGIRSGVFEPLALMGHNVVFLEHKGMFTPERHASWQEIIPYHRLRIKHTTGYLNMQTETHRDNVRDHVLTNNLNFKSKVGSQPEGKKEYKSKLPKLIKEFNEKDSITDQKSLIEAMNDDFRNGVMTTSELALLVKIVETKQTIHGTCKLVLAQIV